MSVAAWAAGVLARRPFNALAQVTNRCNMRCPFCDFWPNGAPKEELSAAEWARVARELAGLGTFLVSVEGGEPLVRPDLPEIIHGFRAAGHLPILYTNGWFMDEERVAALVAAGLHQVGVSVDFPDAARHDAMRRTPGAFERAIAAVERLRGALGGRRVHLMSVLMRENQEDLEALFQRSAALGVGHHVTLLSDQGFRRGKLDDATRPDAHVMAQLPVLARRFGHVSSFRSYLEGIPRFLSAGDLPRCRAGFQSFNIDHIGQVAACIETLDRPVGSVREASMATLAARLKEADVGRGCQACWTLCRGTATALGQGGGLKDWVDLRRM